MKILFIAHRLPYPPNKGDKIRSYHILRHISQGNEVYLASMVDDPGDMKHAEALRSYVNGMCCDVVRPWRKKVLGGFAILRSKPISVSYFYSRMLQCWIDDLLEREHIDVIFCSSSPTAEYVFRSRCYRQLSMPLIMDLMDVDSYKWQQYSERTKGPMRIVYKLEAKHLRHYEKRIANEFSRVVLVSEAEKALFLARAPGARAYALVNGVDLDYFSPSFVSSLPSNGPVMVFTGVMDYWPNAEGVQWFVREVLPLVQREVPNISFYIVGSSPCACVRRLGERFPGVTVTGYVDDIRTYIAAATVCVAPLRIARGIQNKVLEAMAMAKPVVCTTQALQGIHADPKRDVITADDAEGFSAAVIKLVKDSIDAQRFGQSARVFAENNFSWDKNLSFLDTLLDAGVY